MPARRSAVRLVVAAGTLAAAVGSIVGLGGTVASWLDAPPPGEVRKLTVQPAQSMTYGTSLEREERGAAATVGPADRRVPGKLIAYDLETVRLTTDDVLPVRIILYNISRGTSRTFEGQPVIGGDGDNCGCSQWVPVPHGRTRYRAEVQIFPPGKLKPGQQPVRRKSTPEFTGSTA